MPTAPTVACYETATFNATTCQYDVTGTMPTAPTVACYETATFNATTCQYDVTGTIPTAPTVACYETATFNATTCQYDVTGTMPTAPTVACYETATFNTTSCAWDVTGTEPVRNIAVASQCNNDNLLSVDILDLINTDFPGVATVTGTWSVSPATSGLNTTTGEFLPFGLPSGNYVVTYNNNDPACPGIVTITIPVDDTCVVLGCDTVEIHNAFTPNGDGINEWFQIDNIEQPCHLPNTVEIYNRWGVLVYETKNYDNNTRRFEGISEGRTTVNKSSELPTGTYFYIIQWTDGTQKVTKDGYLYLTR
jgi:gliding motility-associated-like protein